MSDILIVGGGIFGITAAKLAERRGAKVTIFDALDKHRATSASGFLLRPSWLTSLSKDKIEKGYAILTELFGVEKLEFRVLPSKLTVGVDRAVFKVPSCRKYGLVTKVGNGVVHTHDGKVHTGKVLVSAGVKTGELVFMPPIKSLMGVSLRFHGQQIREPLMNVWSPYKQALAFNESRDTVWFGDGTAILEKNWNTSERVEDAVKRAKKLFKLQGTFSEFVGARPVVEGHKDGYFDRVYKNTWVSTGGGKIGTILAALQAAEFIKEALG